MEKTQIKFRCGHTLRQMLDKFDISIASVQDQLNQGDLSEDGSYNICGNIIMIRYPTVQLRPRLAADRQRRRPVPANSHPA